MNSDPKPNLKNGRTPSEPHLYGTLRFWHRWASLLTAPFLLIVSLTGALLVFHDWIDHWFRPGSNQVVPSSAPVSIQAAIVQVEESVEGWVSTDWSDRGATPPESNGNKDEPNPCSRKHCSPT